MLRQFVILASVLMTFALSFTAQAQPRLIMVDQAGCVYCERWEAAIGPIYPKSQEGQFAPLTRRDIADGAPENVTYARRVNFTPTFILVENGTELARIEGYPGEDFFWGLLGMILEKHTDFAVSPKGEKLDLN